MKIVLALSILLVVAAGTAWWLGARAPLRHRAGVSATLRQPPTALFDAIADVAHAPQWRKDVRAVEWLHGDGAPRFRERGSNGDIVYRIEASERPRRFVTRIDDPALPFGGSWTFAITPDGAGSRVEIVEDGEIRSVPFRFFAHYVFGYYGTLENYLAALAAKFGEAVDIRRS